MSSAFFRWPKATAKPAPIFAIASVTFLTICDSPSDIGLIFSDGTRIFSSPFNANGLWTGLSAIVLHCGFSLLIGGLFALITLFFDYYRSEEPTSELQLLLRISFAVFSLNP